MTNNLPTDSLIGFDAKEILRSIFLEVLPRVELRSSFSHVAGVLTEIQDRSRTLGQSGRTPTLISVGKAAGEMAKEVTSRCRLVNVAGLACSPYENLSALSGLETFMGGHPVPNDDSVSAARRTIELLEPLTADDLVIFLISGGGSAAFEATLEPTISTADLRATYDLLVGCGAGIEEVNAVRKHLSAVKGGRLARIAYPARQITLFVSDVPEDHDSAVASGLTMPDETTIGDTLGVLDAYKLDSKLPPAVLAALRSPDLAETPKHGDIAFTHSSFHCLVSNRDALESARHIIEARGWHCEIDTSTDELSVEASSKALFERAQELAGRHERPICVLAGGEVRSVVRGPGRGGRNQAWVLDCVPRLAGQRIAVLSAGTDGIDGNSEAAGAVADGSSLRRAQALDLDVSEAMNQSDANTFFRALQDDVVTGPTGNNVRDLRIVLAW